MVRPNSLGYAAISSVPLESNQTTHRRHQAVFQAAWLLLVTDITEMHHNIKTPTQRLDTDTVDSDNSIVTDQDENRKYH